MLIKDKFLWRNWKGIKATFSTFAEGRILLFSLGEKYWNGFCRFVISGIFVYHLCLSLIFLADDLNVTD